MSEGNSANKVENTHNKLIDFDFFRAGVFVDYATQLLEVLKFIWGQL